MKAIYSLYFIYQLWSKAISNIKIKMEKYLKSFLERYDTIQAIAITDKDGIDISAAFGLEDKLIKQSQSAVIFAAAFMQTNEHLTKLSAGKAKSITLFYDNYIVYQESWDGGILLNVFAKPESNVAKIYEIASKIKENLKFLNETVKKIQ